jgi:dihydrolipoamide dehydrogenase
MATVYHELGAQITVELMDQLIPGAGADVVRPLAKRIGGRYENVYLKTKVTAVEAGSDGLQVNFEGPAAPGSDVLDQVLVTVGRVPSGPLIGAEAAGVAVDDRGYIRVDKQQRTNVPHIFAIGDIAGQPMLRPQGHPRGQGRRRGGRWPAELPRRQGHSLGRLHRP